MIKQPLQGSGVTARPRLAARRRSSLSRASHGQVMVMFALMLTAMIGMLALVFDIGYGLVQRRISQNIADSTATAGTQTMGYGAPIVVHDGDVYAIIQDVALNNNVPQSRLTITTPAGVGTTPAQVYVVGQYVDSSGTDIPGVYVTNAAGGALPAAGKGVHVRVTIRYNTFFAGVIGYPAVTVSGSATAVNKYVQPAGFSSGIQPFAARWDPPYGPSNAPSFATSHPANDNTRTGCLVPVTLYQCHQYGSTPNPALIPIGTQFLLWENGDNWLPTNTNADPDWPSGSSSFKGIFTNLTNNCFVGNQGQGEGSRVGQIPTFKYNVALFPLVDYSNTGTGSNLRVNVYSIVALQVIDDGHSIYGTMISQYQLPPIDPACGSTQLAPGPTQFVASFLVS